MTWGGDRKGPLVGGVPPTLKPDEKSTNQGVPASGEPWTPILLTRWSGHYLSEKGIDSGRLDAELILAHVLGLGRLDLYLQHDRPLLPEELAAFKALLKRRGVREPLQHVLGTAPFRELDLRSDSRALIPRPETEVLVGEILTWAVGAQKRYSSGPPPESDTAPDPKTLTALDIGTGTGAISLSLLKEGPFRQVVGTDLSGKALDVARENAMDSGLSESLELREGHLFDPVRAGERFHVVASNPPYVPEGDRDGLSPEVRDWEPPSALFAGPEGLDVLLPLIRGVPDALVPGGLLALEVGDGQATRVARAVEETGAFSEIRIRPDLAGRERVVLGVA